MNRLINAPFILSLSLSSICSLNADWFEEHVRFEVLEDDEVVGRRQENTKLSCEWQWIQEILLDFLRNLNFWLTAL